MNQIILKHNTITVWNLPWKASWSISQYLKRAIFWENLTEPGSDILRFCSFLVILYKWMEKDYCEFFFEKNLVIVKIWSLEIWPNFGQNSLLKQESIFWFFNFKARLTFSCTENIFWIPWQKFYQTHFFFQNLKMFTFLEIMAWNQENLEFCKFLMPNISVGLSLHIKTVWCVGSYASELQNRKGKNMCKL